MHETYKVHYEIYENALSYLNDLMKKSEKPMIKSINDDYQAGDLVLIKDDALYHVGAFNGIFMEIVRDNVNVPKSDVELELDRIREENQMKIESLKTCELTSKTDRELYLEAQQKKREKHFEDSTKYITVVMSDSYFRNVLNSVPLLDRFNIIVSNSLKESKELNDTVDTYGYSVLFTCSVDPVDWLTAIDLIYDTEKNPHLIYDTSVLYVIGDMKLFSSLYKQIKVYFVILSLKL
jgi:hypothetical protein